MKMRVTVISLLSVFVLVGSNFSPLALADQTHLTPGGLELEDTTSSTTGVVYKDSKRFMHNFHHPTGGTAVPVGWNLFVGENAGNFTMGSTATSSSNGSTNTCVGHYSGYAITTGYRNSFFGTEAGRYNDTGCCNSFFGRWTGYNNKAGSSNSFFGIRAGNHNETGDRNSFFGVDAGYFNI